MSHYEAELERKFRGIYKVHMWVIVIYADVILDILSLILQNTTYKTKDELR